MTICGNLSTYLSIHCGLIAINRSSVYFSTRKLIGQEETVLWIQPQKKRPVYLFCNWCHYQIPSIKRFLPECCTEDLVVSVSDHFLVTLYGMILWLLSCSIKAQDCLYGAMVFDESAVINCFSFFFASLSEKYTFHKS